MQNNLAFTLAIVFAFMIAGAFGSGLVPLPKMDLKALWPEKQEVIVEAPEPVRVKAARKPVETVCAGVMRGGFCVLSTQDNAPTMTIR